MRDELVARARNESRGEVEVDEDGERKMESMISSLYPTSWRLTRDVLSEWNRMFWSECTDRSVDVVGLYLGEIKVSE